MNKKSPVPTDINTIHNPSEFFIETPMITKLNERIHQWLWNGSTGGLILGDYRMGKTRAMQDISSKLENRHGQPIPTFRMSMTRRDVYTVASVFRNLCYSLNKNISSQATADQMSNNLLHFFAEQSQQNDSSQIVLIVDEMQRLTLRQLEAFAEIHDALAELKINLCVIFVGNISESQSLLQSVMSPNYELIRGRFFIQSYLFYGLKSHSDVLACLEEFDKKNYFTTDQHSITQYFLSEGHSAGWRLTSISNEIWQVFYENYKTRLNLESWGMHYFISTIKTLLIDYLPRYGVDDTNAVLEMIDESIKVSGLVPDLTRLIKC